MYVNKYIQCSIRSGLLKDMMIQMQIQTSYSCHHKYLRIHTEIKILNSNKSLQLELYSITRDKIIYNSFRA